MIREILYRWLRILLLAVCYYAATRLLPLPKELMPLLLVVAMYLFALRLTPDGKTVESSYEVKPPNDPSSATRPTRASDCNREAMAGFAAAHG